MVELHGLVDPAAASPGATPTSPAATRALGGGGGASLGLGGGGRLRAAGAARLLATGSLVHLDSGEGTKAPVSPTDVQHM